jgi:hypothetical protein
MRSTTASPAAVTAAAIAAAAALAAAATPAAAQNWNRPAPPVAQECQQSLNNNRLGGAAVGAAIGAVAGSQLAGRGQRTEASVLGAVIGGLAGRELAGRRLACDDAAYNQGRVVSGGSHPNYGYNNNYNNNYNNGYGYQAPQPAYDPYYNQGYQGGYSHQTSYTPPRQVRGQCGWGEARYTTPDGRVSRQDVWMCLDRRGAWVVQQ